VAENHNAPSSSLHECDTITRPSIVDSYGNHRSSFNTSFGNRLPIEASNGQHVWQHYNFQPDYANQGLQASAMEMSPRHDQCDGVSLEGLDSSRTAYEECLMHGAEANYSPQDSNQEEYRRNSYYTCSPSPLLADNYAEYSPTAQCSTMSSVPQTFIPSPPADSAWVSVADSAYGSLPNSCHGSGSSQADSMMHATHYFDAAPATTITDSTTPRQSHVEHRDRSRQDAHSRVEKRYRLNINSKIQELREFLDNPSTGKQFFNTTTSRRQKSGAELSKRDVLSRTITHLTQLEAEVQQLTSQNIELKNEKLALIRSISLASDS
jgi:Helix-loop-helix DNA-binding domain